MSRNVKCVQLCGPRGEKIKTSHQTLQLIIQRVSGGTVNILGGGSMDYCGPGSSVGIVTKLRAGRSGIESRWGRVFPPVQTGPVAHPASCTMGTGSFPGGKVRPGRAADHSPSSSAAVMEK